MIRTSLEIENYVIPLGKALNLENESKWFYLRFMLNVSLSLKTPFEAVEYETKEGKEYRLEQITGEGKGSEDYTKFYWDAIEVFEDITITSKKALELHLQRHIFRGYHILSTSLKHDSNIFDFMLQDF
ncbi:MAG: DndE family protein [Sulfuricurvum sp.]|uniref:DndE family protein n=1 Tax=Sulfuricurvum sp. TaxID=2025608 RepID=UPI00272558DA|nr:DndE family protein [Sulfuricurvum sp.]MDO9055339.1 DndE family protein [Sulfuricurvum sp.]